MDASDLVKYSAQVKQIEESVMENLESILQAERESLPEPNRAQLDIIEEAALRDLIKLGFGKAAAQSSIANSPARAKYEADLEEYESKLRELEDKETQAHAPGKIEQKIEMLLSQVDYVVRDKSEVNIDDVAEIFFPKRIFIAKNKYASRNIVDAVKEGRYKPQEVEGTAWEQEKARSGNLFNYIIECLREKKHPTEEDLREKCKFKTVMRQTLEQLEKVIEEYTPNSFPAGALESRRLAQLKKNLLNEAEDNEVLYFALKGSSELGVEKMINIADQYLSGRPRAVSAVVEATSNDSEKTPKGETMLVDTARARCYESHLVAPTPTYLISAPKGINLFEDDISVRNQNYVRELRSFAESCAEEAVGLLAVNEASRSTLLTNVRSMIKKSPTEQIEDFYHVPNIFARYSEAINRKSSSGGSLISVIRDVAQGWSPVTRSFALEVLCAAATEQGLALHVKRDEQKLATDVIVLKQ